MKKEQKKTVETEITGSTRFYLRTLGDLALDDKSERSIGLRTRKSLLLLACLASTSGQSWPREKLASMFWGERQEEQARNSLRSAFSDIRRALGKNALAVEGNSVRLISGLLTSDLEHLRQLAQSTMDSDPGALGEFYNGDYLADVDAGAQSLEWVNVIRSEARDLASAILERGSDVLVSAGNNEIAIMRARDLLLLDPLSERNHRRLMRLYADLGERSKAIAQFQSCVEMLKRDLDIEPSPETRQLADEIAVRSDSALPDMMEITTAPLQVRSGINGLKATAQIDDGGAISIAVLQFVNMSGDADQDYFAQGISEDIITDLSKITDLSVTAAGSTRMYSTATMRPSEIATELGVKFLLEGSVRRSDRELRITVSLIDGRTNRQIWGERYDRKLVNIFDVQAEIAASVANAVHSEVSPAVISKVIARGTHNLEAHEHYLRGRALLKEMTRRSVEFSKSSFEQAIDIDNNYSLAYAGLAESITMLAWHYEAETTVLEAAISYCHKALELNPGLAEAHCSLGRVHSLFLRIEEAEAEFKRAVEISPSLQEAHLYSAFMYLTIGHPDRAIAPLRQAFELGRQDLQTGMMLINCLQALGLSEELRNTANQVLYLAQRRIKLNPYDDQAAYVGAMALHTLGKTSDAMRWANLAAAYDIDDPRSTYNVACLFAILGKTKPALDFLRKTLELGVPSIKLEWIRHHDSDWADLRDDPQFNKIVGF